MDARESGCTTFGSGVSTETWNGGIRSVIVGCCTTFGSGVSTETPYHAMPVTPETLLHDLRLRGEY